MSVEAKCTEEVEKDRPCQVLTKEEEELVNFCDLRDPRETYTDLLLKHIMESLGELDIGHDKESKEDLEALKELPASEKCRALLMAARRGYTQCVSWLLQTGTNPNAEDENGYTALMFLAAQGLDQSIREILSKKCMVNKRTASQQTALHFAAEKGHRSSTQLLLDNGAMVNAADDWGETPLIMAVNSGSLGTVSTLLIHGAQLDKTDLRGFDAFISAAKKGHRDIMNLLIENGAIMNKCKKTSALHEAARFGHVHCVRLLLEYGAELNVRDVHDVLPMELATQTDQAEVVECLLRYVEMQDKKDPLVTKCKTVKPMSVPDPPRRPAPYTRSSSLATAGCRQAAIYSDQRNSALAAAAFWDAGKCLRVLLAHGASPDATDRHGVPAFFLAVAQNNMDIVVTLIQHQVDLVSKTVSKVYFYTSDLWSLIRPLGCDQVTALHIAILCGFARLIRVLVTVGASQGILIGLNGAFSGFRPYNDISACLLDHSLLAPSLQQDAAFMQWLDEQRRHHTNQGTNVTSLKHGCRGCIRKQLHQPAVKSVEALPLPKALQEYLTYSELRDIDVPAI